ncbi:hypothetical protein AOCH_003598 [Aspergillus ochraceoroseus]|uniref:Uncharacterized protein n=1 Tax=Aspergillus ochraceoroseus TaxID=138278 RepID=A0A0F8UCT1_9EURO|nr:hypothetical protein AOCH_003598 [Aspergillus ochraceoroseus]
MVGFLLSIKPEKKKKLLTAPLTRQPPEDLCLPPLPPREDENAADCPGWNTSPEGPAGKKGAVKRAIISTMAFGSGRQVEEDPDDFGTQGKLSRAKKPVVEKTQKKYRGRQAYRLFLHIYQLIVWKQCHALVKDRGFPPELEHYEKNVIRDLWALRLGNYANKINDPTDEDSQPEFFSSQPGSAREDTETEAFKPGSKIVQWPRLIDTVSLCYLGAFLMRLPTSIGDFYRMVMRNDIPYFRVLIHIPRDMKDKLPQEYMALLETTRLLKPDDLHTAVFDLLMLYHLDVYPAVTRLQNLLGFTFKYSTKVVGRRKPLDKPELQLITLIVISTKLLFPFDDVERHPTCAQEPAVHTIDWAAWGEVQRRFENREALAGKISKDKEILVNENDVLAMTPDQLDQYMDWYENNWLDLSKGSGPLSALFPVGPQSKERKHDSPAVEDNEEEAIEFMLQNAPRYVKSATVVDQSDTKTSRPGSFYTRYRQESDLPDTARSFYETAAKVAGISLSILVRCVSQAEIQINKWLEDRRRAKHFAERSMIESIGEDVDKSHSSSEDDEPSEGAISSDGNESEGN